MKSIMSGSILAEFIPLQGCVRMNFGLEGKIPFKLAGALHVCVVVGTSPLQCRVT